MNDLVTTTFNIHGQLTDTRYFPPEGMEFDDWVTVGEQFCKFNAASQWWIGDWWAFGNFKYGDRAKAAAAGIFGKSYQVLMNIGSVAREFDESRRRDTLSFTHHQEVRALPKEVAEELLDKAESENLSCAKLRTLAKQASTNENPVREAKKPKVEEPAPFRCMLTNEMLLGIANLEREPLAEEIPAMAKELLERRGG